MLARQELEHRLFLRGVELEARRRHVAEEAVQDRVATSVLAAAGTSKGGTAGGVGGRGRGGGPVVAVRWLAGNARAQGRWDAVSSRRFRR